tara:strand:- start:300 stop:995 length:696 start_codon:yes stop_codon:yes gene_type:complete
MLKYFISFFVFINCISLFSQKENEIDSINKSTFGIKIGLDISKQIRMLTEPEYKGLVFIGDYRILDKIYIAIELGSEEKLVNNEVLNFKTKGSFYKAGINYNVFKNIQNLENEIYIGFRYGSSKFDHQLNSFTIYNIDQYWNQNNIISSSSYENLNAKWLEFIVGFKAQVIKNFYMGLNLNVNRFLSQKRPENFSNLYIPGFNKVLENNNIGVGFSYTIQYQIPLFRKVKN